MGQYKIKTILMQKHEPIESVISLVLGSIYYTWNYIFLKDLGPKVRVLKLKSQGLKF
jgi:hypothetical protein